MARPTTTYVCSDCGQQEPRWMGQCPGCGAWSTLVEERVSPAVSGRGAKAGSGGGAAAGRAAA
ncbi:MAG: radA, partial [Solirubrobacterales bacterium]|nr:radA [Solirubrobacterales bacterium]